MRSLRLLVVAGEASGDRAAAAVIDAIGPANVELTAVGGAAMQARGAELIGDLRSFTAMGFTELAARAQGLVGTWRRTRREIARGRFDVALLVGFSDFNVRLLGALRRARTPSVFYGPPQVWAWRPERARFIRENTDALCVMLPFEEDYWRAQGANAVYVGHPATETTRVPRVMARDSLGLTQTAHTVAILPGSRPHEVRSLARPMLDAYEIVRRDRSSLDARLIASASLDAETLSWLARESDRSGVALAFADPGKGAAELLGAFDVALTASGTASLEAAVARAVPVVAYRVSLLSEAIARAMVRTPHIALPNIILGRRAFAEHVQREVEPETLARSLRAAIRRLRPLRAECDEVVRRLGSRQPSVGVARVVEELRSAS